MRTGYQAGIIQLDLHGKNCDTARAAVLAALRKAGAEVYRIRVIHGFNHGTALMDMLRGEFARHPRVRRMEISAGSTDLILREF